MAIAQDCGRPGRCLQILDHGHRHPPAIHPFSTSHTTLFHRPGDKSADHFACLSFPSPASSRLYRKVGPDHIDADGCSQTDAHDILVAGNAPLTRRHTTWLCLINPAGSLPCSVLVDVRPCFLFLFPGWSFAPLLTHPFFCVFSLSFYLLYSS